MADLRYYTEKFNRADAEEISHAISNSEVAEWMEKFRRK